MLKQPQDPYSPEWVNYWVENPGLLRGVGAEAAVAVEDDDTGGEDKGDALTKDELDAALKDEDWRTDLPDDLQETAKRFASKADAIRSVQDLRKRESQVRVPGKGAGDDEISAYRKAVGIPEAANNYEFPDLPEGQELTDEIKTSREEWGTRFHQLNIPQSTAKALSQMVNEDAQKMLAAQVEADKAFAKSQEDALRTEWKGDDFDKNKTLANRAFADIATRAGVDLDALTQMETKDGRLLMDNASMLRLFSVIGREMSEGTLGPALSENERDTVADQITEVRKQIEEAQGKGNSKLANSLYTKEQRLLAKMGGDKPIVGSQGVAV